MCMLIVGDGWFIFVCLCKNKYNREVFNFLNNIDKRLNK